MESLDRIIGHMASIRKHKWIFVEDCTGAVNHQSLLEVRNQCKFTISASVQHYYIFRVGDLGRYCTISKSVVSSHVIISLECLRLI